MVTINNFNSNYAVMANKKKQNNAPAFEGNKFVDAAVNTVAAGMILAAPVGAATIPSTSAALMPPQATIGQVYQTNETSGYRETYQGQQEGNPLSEFIDTDAGKWTIGGGAAAVTAAGIGYLMYKNYAKEITEEEVGTKYGENVGKLYKDLRAEADRGIGGNNNYHLGTYVYKEGLPNLILNGESDKELYNTIESDTADAKRTAQANETRVTVHTDHWQNSMRMGNGTQTTHYSKPYYEDVIPETVVSKPTLKQKINQAMKPMLLECECYGDTDPRTHRSGPITSYTTYTPDPPPPPQQNNN